MLAFFVECFISANDSIIEFYKRDNFGRINITVLKIIFTGENVFGENEKEYIFGRAGDNNDNRMADVWRSPRLLLF